MLMIRRVLVSQLGRYWSIIVEDGTQRMGKCAAGGARFKMGKLCYGFKETGRSKQWAQCCQPVHNGGGRRNNNNRVNYNDCVFSY